MLGAREDFSQLPMALPQDLRELDRVIVRQTVIGTQREIGTHLIPPPRAVCLDANVAEQFPGQLGGVDNAERRAELAPLILGHRRLEPVAARDEGIENRGESAY